MSEFALLHVEQGHPYILISSIQLLLVQNHSQKASVPFGCLRTLPPSSSSTSLSILFPSFSNWVQVAIVAPHRNSGPCDCIIHWDPIRIQWGLRESSLQLDQQPKPSYVGHQRISNRTQANDKLKKCHTTHLENQKAIITGWKVCCRSHIFSNILIFFTFPGHHEVDLPCSNGRDLPNLVHLFNAHSGWRCLQGRSSHRFCHQCQ